MWLAVKDFDMVRAVHRFEQIALDLNIAQTIGQIATAAPFAGEQFEAVAFDNGRVLAVSIIRKMATGFVKTELADVRRKDLKIALFFKFFADEGLEYFAKKLAVGCPENEPLADRFVDVKEFEFFAEHTMVAGLGLFELFEVGIEVFFLEEGCAIDTGETVGGFIAMPIARREAHDFDRADAAGAGYMRPSAEVFPILARFAGGIERETDSTIAIGGLDRAFGVIDFIFTLFGFELFHALGLVKGIAGKGPILLPEGGQLARLRLRLQRGGHAVRDAG